MHRACLPADWLQALRCVSKQAKTAHFKDAQHGAKSSTMTQGDWEQLCAECEWGIGQGWGRVQAHKRP